MERGEAADDPREEQERTGRLRHRERPGTSAACLDQQGQPMLRGESLRLIIDIAHRVETTGTRRHLHEVEWDADLRATTDIGAFRDPKGGY